MKNADQRWSEVCDRWSVSGYNSLSTPEKTWLNVRSLIDAVENGGIISYFYNSGADRLPDCMEGLRLLGAIEVVEQVQQVCELFPAGVPSGLDARNEVIDSWGDNQATDALLESADSTLMPLMPDLENRLSDYLRSVGLAG